MSRPKQDPVEETFRRWVALNPEQQQRLTDMIAGFRAAGGDNLAAIPTPRTPRKRAPKPAPVEAA